MGPLTPLIATEWPEFLMRPDTLVFMVPITALAVFGIIGMAKLVMRHRERMAMIERGIDPDRPAGLEK